VILLLAKNRQTATQFSENGIFCRKFLFLRKTIAEKRQKTGLLAMVSPHLCQQVSKFLAINSPVK